MFLASIPYRLRLIAPLFLMCLVLSAATTASPAQPFPSAGTYDFYMLGTHGGSNTFTAAIENNHLVIRSTTSIHLDNFELDLESKTVVTKDSLRILAFSYTGKRGKSASISGSAKVAGDSITGFIEAEGHRFPSKRMIHARQSVFFENYVAEHEILLARVFLQSGLHSYNLSFFYPSEFVATSATVYYESDVELETMKGSVLCTKITIALEGGPPFFSYIDKASKIPIYMDFPGVNTEIFCRDYFGDEAKPKYRRPE